MPTTPYAPHAGTSHPAILPSHPSPPPLSPLSPHHTIISTTALLLFLHCCSYFHTAPTSALATATNPTKDPIAAHAHSPSRRALPIDPRPIDRSPRLPPTRMLPSPSSPIRTLRAAAPEPPQGAMTAAVAALASTTSATGPTLLPHSVASLVSLLSTGTGMSIRLGAQLGAAVLDTARAGTLASLELSRAAVEGVVRRGGHHVAAARPSDPEAGQLTSRGVLPPLNPLPCLPRLPPTCPTYSTTPLTPLIPLTPTYPHVPCLPCLPHLPHLPHLPTHPPSLLTEDRLTPSTRP